MNRSGSRKCVGICCLKISRTLIRFEDAAIGSEIIFENAKLFLGPIAAKLVGDI